MTTRKPHSIPYLDFFEDKGSIEGFVEAYVTVGMEQEFIDDLLKPNLPISRSIREFYKVNEDYVWTSQQQKKRH